MGFDLGTIGGAITLDGSKYFGTMDQVDDSTRATMSNVKKYVADAVTVYGSYRLAKAAAMASMGFEKELANIRSITNGLSKAELTSHIMAIDSALGRSKDLASATFTAYSSGISGTAAQVSKFSEIIAATNTAAVGELGSTMDAITSLMNAYEIPVTRAAKAGDWFFTVIERGKGSGQDLATSLGQITGSAKMVEMSLDDLGASISALSNIMPIRQAITGLNQAINGFVRPTDDAKKVAAGYGIELSAAALKAKGFAGALEEIRQKVGADPDKLAKMFTSTEAIKVLGPLLGSLNQSFKENVTAFENNAGAVNKAMTEQLDTSVAKWTAAMNDIDKAMITTGNAIKPFTDLLAMAVSGFGQLVQSAPPAVVQVAAIGVAVTLIRSRLMPLIKDLIAIPSNLAVISASLRANTGAIGSETGAWAANTAAIKANNVARAGHNAGVMAASGMSMMDHSDRAWNDDFKRMRDRQHQANRAHHMGQALRAGEAKHLQEWQSKTLHQASGEHPFQSIVIGTGNSYGPGVYIRGDGNANTLGFVTVIGHNNQTYQFQTFIGDNNDFQSAVNITAIGNGNKGDANAYGSLVIGDLNTINARYVLANGYRNTIAARGARVFGRYLTIADNPANEYGFFIGDGKLVANQPQGVPSFIHRVNKAVLNPLYNPSLDPDNTGTDSNGERQYIPKMAFTTQYRGRLTGTTQTIDPASGPVVLDHDFFNRWKITPNAAVIPELENWLDNDSGELIIYNGGSYIQWPAAWVWANGSIPTLGSVNFFRLYKLDNTIYITEGF